MNKESFVKTMKRLMDLDEKMNAVDSAMKRLNPDFCGLYITDVFDIIIQLVEEAMCDKEHWVSYCIYEKNWLRDFKIGDVFVIHGKEKECVDLSSWDKVYDFLAESSI